MTAELSGVWPVDVAGWLSALADFATAVAVLGGAWLFLLRRELKPRATVTHDVFWQPLPDGQNLLHALVRVHNVGTSRLRLKTAEFRLQQVLPLDWLGAGSPLPSVPGHCEIEWPLVGEPWQKQWKRCVVEPGEVEEICCDYVVPRHVRVIELYTFVQNRIYWIPMGWSATTIHPVEGASHEHPQIDRAIAAETAPGGDGTGPAIGTQAPASKAP